MTHQRRHTRVSKHGRRFVAGHKTKRFIHTNRLGETFLFEEKDGLIRTIKFLGWRTSKGKIIPTRG